MTGLIAVSLLLPLNSPTDIHEGGEERRNSEKRLLSAEHVSVFFTRGDSPISVMHPSKGVSSRSRSFTHSSSST